MNQDEAYENIGKLVKCIECNNGTPAGTIGILVGCYNILGVRYNKHSIFNHVIIKEDKDHPWVPVDGETQKGSPFFEDVFSYRVKKTDAKNQKIILQKGMFASTSNIELCKKKDSNLPNIDLNMDLGDPWA